MRRALALALMAALLLTSCASLVEGEYASSAVHHRTSGENSGGGGVTLEAGNYEELFDAVNALIEGGVERGVVRLLSYEGDMEADLSAACLTAANETPLGAYAVYFINYGLTRVVSYYEATVSIIYRHTAAEMETIVDCSDREELEKLLYGAMESRTSRLTLRMKDFSVTEEELRGLMDRIYYENPASTLYYLTSSVNYYPEAAGEHIMEVTLSFLYTNATIEGRKQAIERRAEELVEEVEGDTVQERLEFLAGLLSESVRFDVNRAGSGAQSRRYSSLNAYGALVLGLAVGEGYAMAMKVLCDKLGIECAVILGRRNNVEHAWNLVRLDNGAYYHLDCTEFDGEGANILNDQQLTGLNYWWDAAAYPACDGESLYGAEFEPPTDPDDSSEPPEPQEPDAELPEEPSADESGEPEEPETPETSDTSAQDDEKIPEPDELGSGVEKKFLK